MRGQHRFFPRGYKRQPEKLQVSQVPRTLQTLLTWLPTSCRNVALAAEKIRLLLLFPCPAVPGLELCPHPSTPKFCHICELGFVSMPGFLPNTRQILKAHCYPQERLETDVSILLGGGGKPAFARFTKMFSVQKSNSRNILTVFPAPSAG